MSKFAKRFASILIRSEGGHIIGIAGGGRFIGRKEFQKEHSDYFEVKDAFSSDLIKDGKLYVSDNLNLALLDVLMAGNFWI